MSPLLVHGPKYDYKISKGAVHQDKNVLVRCEDYLMLQMGNKTNLLAMVGSSPQGEEP